MKSTDTAVVLLAIGMRRGNPAKHTQRLVESGDLIVMVAAGLYEARCRRCFEPIACVQRRRNPRETSETRLHLQASD